MNNWSGEFAGSCHMDLCVCHEFCNLYYEFQIIKFELWTRKKLLENLDSSSSKETRCWQTMLKRNAKMTHWKCVSLFNAWDHSLFIIVTKFGKHHNEMCRKFRCKSIEMIRYGKKRGRRWRRRRRRKNIAQKNGRNCKVPQIPIKYYI